MYPDEDEDVEVVPEPEPEEETEEEPEEEVVQSSGVIITGTYDYPITKKEGGYDHIF